MEWGADVGGMLRDSDACYVDGCWGLLGCFGGGDGSARAGSMKLEEVR